jgi:hypothetical protein
VGSASDNVLSTVEPSQHEQRGMNDLASASARKKRRKNTEFWRSCRYLYPYRRIVTISVIAAFFVGLVFSSGLGAMLPILRVLVNGDTVKGWLDRSVIERKVGVTLTDDASGQIVRVHPDGPAAHAGVNVGDRVTDPIRAVYGDVVDVAGKAITARHVPWYQLQAQRIGNLFPTDREWGAVKTIAIIFIALLLIGIIGNIVRFFQEYLSDKASFAAICTTT